MTVVAQICLLILTLFILARVGYPALTHSRAERSAQSVERNEDGLAKGSEPFQVGEGDTALLLIHGFASSPSVFSEMAPELAKAGVECRALHLPGFGEMPSNMLRVAEAEWRDAVADGVERAKADGKKVWLVGHSLGGTLALDYALAHPENLEGLVLLAPMIKVSSRRSLGLSPEVGQRVMNSILPRNAFLEVLFPVDLNARSHEVDELRDRFLPVAMYDALFRAAAAVMGRGDELKLPVLVVVPGSDRVINSAATRDYFSTIASERKELISAPRAAHVIPLDYGWEDVTREIKSFIDVSAQEGVRR